MPSSMIHVVSPLSILLSLFPLFLPSSPPGLLQLSELEVNGQLEQMCEQVYSAMQAQVLEAAMDSLETMDTLPMPGCFRMRSRSYVRAMDQGCEEEDEEEGEGGGGGPLLLLPSSSPPRTSATTVRTIQSSTGRTGAGGSVSEVSF